MYIPLLWEMGKNGFGAEPVRSSSPPMGAGFIPAIRTGDQIDLNQQEQKAKEGGK